MCLIFMDLLFSFLHRDHTYSLDDLPLDTGTDAIFEFVGHRYQ